MKTLTVLFDAQCAMCRRCREWLGRQPAYLKLEFLPSSSSEVERRFPGLTRTDQPEELVVISDEGGVYRGPVAFIMCLYALKEYRELSLWLSKPAMLPMARGAFVQLSKNRGILSHFLVSWGAPADECAAVACRWHPTDG